jgi:glycerol-3-phosphate O-acyltransferase
MLAFMFAIHWLRWFGWLRLPMRWWIGARVVPQDPRSVLGLDPKKPVCFVTASGALTDLIVLDEQCRLHGLPRPRITAAEMLRRSQGGSSAAHMFLTSLKLFQADRESRRKILLPFAKMVEHARANKDFDVQLVPVSVFWGRNPGKGERSLVKLLFFDDENAGVIQKFFIVLVQGRNVLVQFGRPINLREQSQGQDSSEEVARKLSRVMRVYFKTQRALSVGPSISQKPRVIETILRTKPVRQIIEEESRKSGKPVAKVEHEARKYGLEIAADPSYPYVRVADILLSGLWNRMFTGLVIRGMDRVQEVGATHEIVYMPSHRSHIDYLLLGQSLYSQGFSVPQVAAGINLNFWPVGAFLRRIGAFYIRRTFSGNKLYAAVFSEYVHYLLTRGFPVKFFPEGGRSRTGRLLQPKTGFLSMVVQSFLRNPDRPVALVPVFLGYDRVWEARTYVNELRGSKKRSESVGQLFSAIRDLKKTFGSAYVSCGKPVDLSSFLDSRRPGWRAELATAEIRPAWSNPVTQEIAVEMMARINDAAVLGPVSLVAIALLSVPNRALAEDQLCQLLDAMLKLQKDAPYSEDSFVPAIDGRTAIKSAEVISVCKRLELPGGDVVYADEEDAKVLSYYGNMCAHMFLMPAVVARLFQHCDQLTVNEVVRAALDVWPFFSREFFLSGERKGKDLDKNARIEAHTLRVISAMVESGFIECPGRRSSADLGMDEIVCRPGLSSPRFMWLQAMARICGASLDRVGIGLAMLGAGARNGEAAGRRIVSTRSFRRRDFEDSFIATGKRLDAIRGSEDAAAYDAANIRVFIDNLLRRGLVEIQEVNDTDLENAANAAPSSQVIVALPAVEQLGALPRLLLGTDMAQSIGRNPG